MIDDLMMAARQSGKSVDELMRGAFAGDPQYIRLESTLLAIGGKRMVWVPEPHLDELLSRGKVFPKLVRYADRYGGQANACHQTAARMYARLPEYYQIATGYALSKDGLWRQHSWVCCRPPSRGKPYEPTPIKRECYYGFLLSDKEAAEFVQSNM